MMLMMIFAAGMMFGMPYLMVSSPLDMAMFYTHIDGMGQKNMDPEVLEDFKERQGKIHNIQSSLQSGNIKAGYVYTISVLN